MWLKRWHIGFIDKMPYVKMMAMPFQRELKQLATATTIMMTNTIYCIPLPYDPYIQSIINPYIRLQLKILCKYTLSKCENGLKSVSMTPSVICG